MAHIAPWFPKAKFGVFVHWLHDAPLMDRPDLVRLSDNRDETLHLERGLAGYFTAAKYDPREWAALFKRWGARYAVLTAKHHLGFALYDCPGGLFNAKNSSPAGRDLVGPFVAALREAGLKVGLYFSLPDWSHPDYASCAGPKPGPRYADKDDPARWERFARQMFAEVRHLCTAYGRIDLLWFDGDWERTAEQWRSVELAEMVERLQPGIVLNNRLRHPALGHYGTPEISVPVRPRGDWWELCAILGGNWCGADARKALKPPSELVRLLGDVVGLGGNLLLNVAPGADGAISADQVERMDELGKWIQAHAEAIHGAEPGLPLGLFNGSSTRRGSNIYLIAYDRPQDELVVKGLHHNRIRRITNLRTGRELAWRYSGGYLDRKSADWLFIRLPDECVDRYATVLKIEFEGREAKITPPDGGQLVWRGKG